MDKYVYTADDYGINEAFAKADIVITGKIIKLGIAEPEGMGQIYYYNTEVSIEQVEKGNFSGHSCVLVYQVISIREKKTVPVPSENNSYRFYISIREEGKTLKAFKITDI